MVAINWAAINWRASAAALILSCSFAAAAGAQGITPRCPAPSSSVLLNLMRHTPDAVVVELRGREAKVAIGMFNLLPPAGNERGDRFYIAVLPGAPISRLLVASHGCIENGAVVDIRTAAAIAKAARKVAAAAEISL
jgi:hypothetical protein